MRESIQFVFLGLGLGAMYALVSHGLIVIYRGSGVLNFAQGAVGMAAAYLYYDLRTHGWSFPLALTAGVAGAGLLGFLIHTGIMRHLERASPIARVVATLGILVTLQAIAVLRYGSDSLQPPTDLPSSTVRLFGVAVAVDRLILVAIAVALAAGLWALYRYSSFGRATSAAAENQRAAASLGISPNRIAMLNWILGSALAGLAMILVSPIVTLSPDVFTTLLIAALATALVAGFRSFPVALVAGLLLGVAESEVSLHWSLTGVGPTVPFVVIAVVLLVRGQALPLRDFLFQRLPSVGSGRIRPGLVVVGVVALGLLIPSVPADWQDAITVTFAGAIILLSIVVVTGYAGQMSLAQFALAGFGAWVAGRLAATQGFSFPLAIVAGIVAAVVLGAALSLPALRTRGINLAIMTAGIATAFQLMLFNNGSLTGGFVGTVVGSPTLFGWSIDPTTHPDRYGWVALGCFLVVALMVANLRRGRSGRRLLAVRNNERAAAALGIDVVRLKVYAFALSAGIAALGGILLSFRSAYISYAGYDTVTSITYVGYAVLGGVGYILGAVFGATFAPGSIGVPLGNHVFSAISKYLLLIGGVSIIFVVLDNQDGMAPQLMRRLSRIGGRLARVGRRRQVEPSRATVTQQQRTTPQRVTPMSLSVENLVVKYGAVTAADNVNLAVQPGQIIGLIGPNGAGKTTVIDAITGFTSAQAGVVRLNGEDISRLRVHSRAQRGISRSFQALELFEDMSVDENIRAACDRGNRWSYLRDLVWPAASPLPAQVVAAVNEFALADSMELRTEDLPYGKRRQLAIVRALATGPSVLLLDEPAAGLGEAETAELGLLVRRLADEWGIAILVVEHDMSFVMNVCDELVVLDFGRQIASGPVAEVRTNPAVIDAYLGETDDELKREQEPEHRSDEDAVALAREDAPRDTEELTVQASTSRRNGAAAHDVVLQAHGVSAGYGRQAVVHKLELSVSAGEVVALLGANGAGKTTTLLALVGELPLLEGDVLVNGTATSAPLYRRAREGLALVPEERSALRQLSTLDNLRLGDADPALALELFPELGKRLDLPAGMLSGGEQQMLALGRALSRRPTVLLADELSLGLSPLATQRLLEAVRRAAHEQGTAVLLVEQHVRKALQYADRGYVMRRGHVVVEGTAYELRAQISDIESTYLSAAPVEAQLR
jgi:sulfate-transporting ATPase